MHSDVNNSACDCFGYNVYCPSLQAEGFSDDMIRRFFRPFLGGIFFDRNLGTSSRLFEFVMRMLATGSNCLPVKGIGAVADQMANKLASESIILNAHVTKVEAAAAGGQAQVMVKGAGAPIKAKKGVVVAVEGPEAQRLLGNTLGTSPSKSEPGVGTCCLYFTAPKPPMPGNVLYLNGEDDGIVNNACFPSEVSPSYAPAGKTLCSVSTVGTFDNLSDSALEAAVRSHLTEWFGASELNTWKLLRIYRIPFAQPNQVSAPCCGATCMIRDAYHLRLWWKTMACHASLFQRRHSFRPNICTKLRWHFTCIMECERQRPGIPCCLVLSQLMRS